MNWTNGIGEWFVGITSLAVIAWSAAKSLNDQKYNHIQKMKQLEVDLETEKTEQLAIKNGFNPFEEKDQKLIEEPK